MPVFLQQVTYACFGFSYLIAFLLEASQFVWPRLRWAGWFFGLAGLFAHTIYLVAQRPGLVSPHGSLLAVAWVVTIFYLYGTLHHARHAWAIFVLPIILGLVVVARLNISSDLATHNGLNTERLWGMVHGILVLLSAVGVCVGFLASVMYLIQANRLRKKMNPLSSFKMLSLERLEAMNRRSIMVAAPLLTLGLLLGIFLLQAPESSFTLKLLGTIGLWLVCILLLYLRTATHVPARKLAFLTIGAFVLMLLAFAATHPIGVTA